MYNACRHLTLEEREEVPGLAALDDAHLDGPAAEPVVHLDGVQRRRRPLVLAAVLSLQRYTGPELLNGI